LQGAVFFAPFFFEGSGLPEKMEAPLAGDPVNERGVFFKMFKRMASMVGLNYIFFKNKN
jgi:hypothetical protein